MYGDCRELIRRAPDVKHNGLFPLAGPQALYTRATWHYSVPNLVNSEFLERKANG